MRALLLQELEKGLAELEKQQETALYSDSKLTFQR